MKYLLIITVLCLAVTISFGNNLKLKPQRSKIISDDCYTNCIQKCNKKDLELYDKCCEDCAQLCRRPGLTSSTHTESGESKAFGCEYIEVGTEYETICIEEDECYDVEVPMYELSCP